MNLTTTTSKRVYLDAPNLRGSEKVYLGKAIDAGYVSSVGSFVPEFESRFASYAGSQTALSTQSGTAALHMALLELGIGAGDEVIVPALTFIATVNPVVYVGAKPVFADVDSKTWNIDPKEIEKKITKKTKAIMPVHLYGNPCDMEPITRIAKKRGLYILEDATESLGARYRGRHVGTFGDFGCFSFNGNKIITTGGGGMIICEDKEKIEHIRFLINQGRNELEEYYHSEIGFNYRMTNIEAALGLAQMERLDEFLAQKRMFRKIYKEELKDIGAICFQKEYDDADSSCWLSCIFVNNKMDISYLQNKLEERKIPTRRIFVPITDLPPYKKYEKGGYKNSRSIYEKGLCLPSSTLNAEDDIYHVCDIIKDLFD